ncbi:MAG: PilZ domain-containing protein [Agarilytica sp.]
MGDERREHKRFAVKWRGRVAYGGEVMDVTINDVSKGGVGVIFPYMLTIGTPMSVEFYVKYRGKMERIRAKTRVAFNTILSDNAGAKLGLQFKAIAKEELHILANVLHLLEEEGF